MNNDVSGLDSFHDCWINALLQHILSREGAISIIKKRLVKIVSDHPESENLIKELNSLAFDRPSLIDSYTLLKGVYQKIISLEPAKIANIYLHISKNEQMDGLVTKIFNGEDIHKAFSRQLVTMIFVEILSDNDNRSLEIVEYMVDKNQSID